MMDNKNTEIDIKNPQTEIRKYAKSVTLLCVGVAGDGNGAGEAERTQRHPSRAVQVHNV